MVSLASANFMTWERGPEWVGWFLRKAEQ
jgi:hypothetical protein